MTLSALSSQFRGDIGAGICGFDTDVSLADVLSRVPVAATAFASDGRHRDLVERALRVRAVEQSLLGYFGKGKLHGTIHTCVGQELCGIIVGAALAPGDFVTSNHRCHGHFIGATGNWRGLIDEIVGNRDGVCGGIGGSQHLYSGNFMSNGQQGGLLPVASGLALDRKRRRSGSVVVSFIGEGTLGEGVLYEVLNLSSLWQLPHLIVCENNFYSQSTPQRDALAGGITARAAAFGWTVRESSTWDPSHLEATVDEALQRLRGGCGPVFLLVKTYRLNPHSKGDELRPAAEVELFRRHDPLTLIISELPEHGRLFDDLLVETDQYVHDALSKPVLRDDEYFDRIVRDDDAVWEPRPSADRTRRMNAALNAFYDDWLRSDERVFFMGEDIADPYGGAFKVSMGLTSKYQDRVLTTPISEAAIVGTGIGLAVAGNRTVVEIMFGDFTALAMDQLLNNAAKFHRMYNRQVTCPVVVRTPMGGRRGYGPTHSQSIEGLFARLDNCRIVSLNSLLEVGTQLAALSTASEPVLIFEHKIDYTLPVYAGQDGYAVEVARGPFPTVRVRPQQARPGVTIVAFGGIARLIADHLLEIFETTDLLPELIVPISLRPLDILSIAQSTDTTGRLVVVEEGSSFAGIGAEILAQLAERSRMPVRTARVCGAPCPIPSAPALEATALPSIGRICHAIRQFDRDN